MELGGTSISIPLKHTDVVDLEVEDSDSISSLEIVEPAHVVAEVFSPPRLTRWAPSAGLQPGQAFDLVDGVDLADVHGRALVWSYLNVHRPRCVILSPPCTYFSRLMQISKGKMRVGEYDRQLALGKELLYFAMAVCKYQHSHSRNFVHEHPADALSWNEDSVKEVMLLPGVMVSRFDQCRFGLTSPYSGATIRKRTKFLHNVPALDAEFGDCFCSCRTPHQQIIGAIHGTQLSSYCQVYPRELCKAMLQQIALEIRGGTGGCAPGAGSVGEEG
jgi:hypothetical protein